jgi:hypothetical protein
MSFMNSMKNSIWNPWAPKSESMSTSIEDYGPDIYNSIMRSYNMGSETNFNIRRINNGFLVEAGGVHFCKDMDEVRAHVTSLIEKAFK